MDAFLRAIIPSSSSFIETLAKNISQFNTTGNTQFWCISRLLPLAVAHDNLLTIDSAWSHSRQFFTGYNLCIINTLNIIGKIFTMGWSTVLIAPVLWVTVTKYPLMHLTPQTDRYDDLDKPYSLLLSFIWTIFRTMRKVVCSRIFYVWSHIGVDSKVVMHDFLEHDILMFTFQRAIRKTMLPKLKSWISKKGSTRKTNK